MTEKDIKKIVDEIPSMTEEITFGLKFKEALEKLSDDSDDGQKAQELKLNDFCSSAQLKKHNDHERKE